MSANLVASVFSVFKLFFVQMIGLRKAKVHGMSKSTCKNVLDVTLRIVEKLYGSLVWIVQYLIYHIILPESCHLWSSAQSHTDLQHPV